MDEKDLPPLSKNQRIALATSQFLIGFFIIFMAGAILHAYLPFPGDYGVHMEGVLIGIFMVLHVKRVMQVYEGTKKDVQE